MASFLDAEGLVKSYGDKRVVDALSLRADRGKVLGLLGPNGAGKTTTLRMLYGLLEPEAGVVRYDGRDFREWRTEAKRLIGVCTQDDTIDEDFTVAQNLRVYASYFRPRVQNLDQRIESLLNRFGLREFANASPRTLSGGFRQRLLIARSIVHEPSVLFLDEPTTGLDPSARVDVWELISSMRADELAVVLTTHYMDEAERLSDDLVVLAQGKSVAQGTTKQILGSLLGEHVLVFAANEPSRVDIEAWARQQGRLPTTVLGELRLPITAEILPRFSERFGGVKFAIREPTLDDLFLMLAREPGPQGVVPEAR